MTPKTATRSAFRCILCLPPSDPGLEIKPNQSFFPTEWQAKEWAQQTLQKLDKKTRDLAHVDVYRQAEILHLSGIKYQPLKGEE